MLVFFQQNPLGSYILIGNHARVKSLGIALGLGNVQPPGSAKFIKGPTSGTNKVSKCPAVTQGGLGAAGID